MREDPEKRLSMSAYVNARTRHDTSYQTIKSWPTSFGRQAGLGKSFVTLYSVIMLREMSDLFPVRCGDGGDEISEIKFPVGRFNIGSE